MDDKQKETIERDIKSIFKTSSISYRKPESILNKLRKIKDIAFEYYKDTNFKDSAFIYKTLMKHTLTYLANVNEDHSVIGEFIFECISFYSSSVKKSDDFEKKSFYIESINFYLEEELGFAEELTKLILDNCNEEEYGTLESIILEILDDPDELGLYKYEKLLELALKMYRKFSKYEKYIEMCKLFPESSWERYIYPSEIFEALGEQTSAVNVLEEGMEKCNINKHIVEKRYNELRKKILGL